MITSFVTSARLFTYIFTFQRWVLIPLEILLKMSKIFGIGQKLFRWKKGEKTPKNEWPELVGKGAEEATTIIDKEHPGLKIQIIPENSIVKENFDERRVRIIVDRKQTVIKTPHIG